MSNVVASRDFTGSARPHHLESPLDTVIPSLKKSRSKAVGSPGEDCCKEQDH